ncbi:MAG: hypothetical protein AAFZ18_14820 [Myxococcota bacterium]
MRAPEPTLLVPVAASSLALALAFIPARAEAFSGFLKEPRSGYVKLSFDHLQSSDLYSTSGERLAVSQEFTQNNLSLYAEVGVFDALTVGVSGPLLRLNSFATSEVAAGLGDLQLFLKTGLEWAGFHGALIGAVEFPTGQDELNVETDFDGVRTNLPTGDGETNFWIRAAISRSFSMTSWLHSYASVHGGVNLRTAFSHQIAVGGELGLSPKGWFWLQVSLEALFTPTPVEELNPAGIFLFGEGTEYVAFGLSLSVPIPGTPISITGDYRNTFANLRNLYAGSTFGGGLSVAWD